MPYYTPVDVTPGGPRTLDEGVLFAQRFRVVRALGHGGMGTVYEAVQVALERRVALKLLHPELARDASLAQRFQREAKLLATLRHPHIVEVVDAGVEHDALWIAMEFLEGESLAKWLADRGGRTSPAELLPRVIPVGRALSFMHARGIVHRDVKPENVQLTVDDAGHTVPKLLDLGIARPKGGDGAKLTATGMMLGTPAYIAPEQAWGAGDIAPAADQWSFAAMLYEAFTGSLPHQADTPVAIITRRVSGPPARPETLVRDFDPALADVLMRALSQDPAQRFDTMDALLDALAPFHDAPSARVGVDVAPRSLAPAAPRETAPDPVREAAPETPPTLPHEATSDPVRETAPQPPEEPTPPWRGAIWTVTALAVVGVLAIALRTPQRAPHETPRVTPEPVVAAATDATAGRVTFVFDFSPSSARITLDGAELGAGHASLQVPRDGRAFALRVEAEGAVPYTEVLHATGDVQISRTLLPRDAGVTAVTAGHATTRPTHAAPSLTGRRPIDPTWPQ